MQGSTYDFRQNLMAEEVRFELTEGVNPRRFSRPVPSTTRPFLRDLSEVNDKGFIHTSQAKLFPFSE